MKKQIIIAACLLLFCAVAHSQENSIYKIQDKIKLPGNGGWDYLTSDDATSRLFVSHGTQVQVVDTKTLKLIGTIDSLNGVHGIALTPFNKGFITNGKDSSVTVFDLTTYKKTGRIKVTGANPDAILYDPFSKKIFVYNGRSSNATVIDPNSNKIVATIPLDGKPEFSVTDGNGKIFVNIEDKSEISQIDAKTLKVVNTWPLKPGVEPSGLAIDTTTHRLFSVCDNKLMVVINADNGKVMGTAPIGEGVDGVAFDPFYLRILSSNGEGTLTIIPERDGDIYTVDDNLKTQRGGRTIAIDKLTNHIYIPTAEFEPAPKPTAENPHPRPALKPGTFVILEIVAK